MQHHVLVPQMFLCASAQLIKTSGEPEMGIILPKLVLPARLPRHAFSEVWQTLATVMPHLFIQVNSKFVLALS